MIILAYTFLALLFAAVLLMGWYVVSADLPKDTSCQVKSNFTVRQPKLIDAETGKQIDIKQLSPELQAAIHKMYDVK